MLGLEIKITSQTKESIVKCLKKAVKEIESGSNSMYLPLNDDDMTECSFSISDIKDLDLYGDWSGCLTIERDYEE